VLGAIALVLAVGAGAAPAAPYQQGALALIARAPLGRVAVAVAAVGLLAYAPWKLGQAGSLPPSLKSRRLRNSPAPVKFPQPEC
jgi:hypothetical protein